jgi:hypothetical protein
MIAEFPVYIAAKLTRDQDAALRGMAAREQTTISAMVRKLIEQAATRDLRREGNRGEAP